MFRRYGFGSIDPRSNDRGDAELVVYLDTGTGLRENREYIEDLCETFGWQLWTLRTHESYEEKVQEHGFPGPSRHSIMYRSLKERQIQKLSYRVNGGSTLLDWCTIFRERTPNAKRRTRERRTPGAGGFWHAPIHDWTKDDCREYLDEHDIPHNELWDTLGRSGDCFCGCFGSPEEKLDLRAAGCDYHAEWLEELEEEVDTGDETECWAWGALSDNERRAERVTDDQMTLCSTCELRADGSGSGGGEEP